MPIEQRCFTSKYDRLSNVLMNEVSVSKAYLPPKPSNLPFAPPKDIIHKKFFAIWDTGATNTVITQKVVQDCELKPTGMVKVSHAGGEKITNTYLVNIRLPNKVEVCQIRVTEGIITGQGDVLIGMDIIGRGDFAVTNKNGKTVFSFRIPSVECIDFVKQPYKGTPVRTPPRISRNAPCPCGSGKKYKYCCLNKDN